MHITQKLIYLYDLRAVIRERREKMRDLLPPGYLEKLETLEKQEKELAESIRKDALAVLSPGESVSAAGLVVAVAKRVSWDDRWLQGYAAKHPEILEARKETVYASITEAKKREAQ